MNTGKSGITEKMDSAVEVPKTLPTIVEKGNKRNEVAEEVVGNKRNEIKRKRGRPFDKDKEGLPVSRDRANFRSFEFECRIRINSDFARSLRVRYIS